MEDHVAVLARRLLDARQALETGLLNDAAPHEEDASLLREEIIQRILEEDPEFGDYSLAGKILRTMPTCSPLEIISETERQKFTKSLRRHLKRTSAKLKTT